MAFAEWADQYSVGNALLDNQHQQLLAIINELHQAIRAKKGGDQLAEAVHSLITHTRSHFADEENMMAADGFPGYAEHKSVHQRLLQQVIDIEGRLHHGSESMTPDVLCFFLNEWLLKHILEMDKQYTPYLAGARQV